MQCSNYYESWKDIDWLLDFEMVEQRIMIYKLRSDSFCSLSEIGVSFQKCWIYSGLPTFSDILSFFGIKVFKMLCKTELFSFLH